MTDYLCVACGRPTSEGLHVEAWRDQYHIAQSYPEPDIEQYTRQVVDLPKLSNGRSSLVVRMGTER